jgi:pantoate--beta-alanine ligase
MRVIERIAELRSVMARLRGRCRTIGFVPTMGAFHQGHCSLIRASVARYEATVVSIFVNPLQFGPREDYRRYPRDLERDVRLAREAGAEVVFAPSVQQLYPKGFQTVVEVGDLGTRWEGCVRRGHFRGVATVVMKLFNLVQPTHALFGQKDYQQALIIAQLTKDLNVPITVRILPTVREPDGLAMSSRNQYLSEVERGQATVLYHTLREARARIRAGVRHARPVLAGMRRQLSAQPRVRPEYVAIVDAKTLTSQQQLHGRLALLVAVWVGRTRLIDNLLVEVP